MLLDDEKERLYCLQEANQQNWTICILKRNIKNGYFRRLLSFQNQKQQTYGQILLQKTKIFIRDFLLLGHEYYSVTRGNFKPKITYLIGCRP